MLPFPDPRDFSQLKLGLSGPPKPLHESACILSLNFPSLALEETLLQERFPSVLLTSAVNTPSPLLLFGLGCIFWLYSHHKANPGWANVYCFCCKDEEIKDEPICSRKW